jgi:PAS domain S-box-containing protein
MEVIMKSLGLNGKQRSMENFIHIDRGKLDILFPFYFIIDNEFNISEAGKSIHKLLPTILNSSFYEVFKLKRPSHITLAKENAVAIQNQVVILESKSNKDLLFRGQFVFFNEDETILFVGSPWLIDVDDLKKHALSIHDFAIHNTVTDMMQIIKSKELVMNDIKELVNTLKVQKQDLNNANNQLSALIQNLQSAVLVENEERKIVLVNKKFCQLFQIPVDPEFMIGLDCSQSTEQVKGLFKAPEEFVNRITIILNNKKIVTNEILYLNDGKILERDFIPIYANNHYSGHLCQYRDVTTQRNIDLQIKQNEEKYRNIIENLKLGLLEVDANNIIRKAYPKFCELTGYSDTELIGKNAKELFLTQGDIETMLEQNKKREAGQASVYDVRIKKKDGSFVWVTISEAQNFDLNNKNIGSIGIHQDISERKQKEEEIKKAKELAEHSLKIKGQFLANMSHEIRTPLNVIIGMSDILSDSDMVAEQKEDFKILRSSADHLLSIVNDILDLSKIESGKISINETYFNIRDLILEQVQLQNNNAKKKDLKLNVSFDSNLPVNIYGDDFRLKQIISNLISNAIKFTEIGQISFTAEIETENEEKYDFLFAISDTGIGVPFDKKEMIFETFTQASNDTTRLYGGTGLGLSIVKNLVEVQGGKIWLESEINKGSTFFVRIPFKKKPTDSIKTIIKAKKNYDSDLVGIKILLVEDNEFNTLVATKTLEKWGCIIEVAENGKEALNKIEFNIYDVVLMDIQMPEMDGYETTRKIRSHKIENVSSLSIIAMTAHAFEGIEEKCKNVGIDDYISKPFVRQQLYDKITKQIILKKMANSVLEVYKNNDLFDLSYLIEISDGNSDFIINIINIFKTETPHIISALKYNNNINNKIELAKIIHQFKANVKSMGVVSLSNKIAEFERCIIRNDEIELTELVNEIIFESENIVKTI